MLKTDWLSTEAKFFDDRFVNWTELTSKMPHTGLL